MGRRRVPHRAVAIDPKLREMDGSRRQEDDRSVTDALREAIERTLQATAPAASQTRERAGELLDEVARLGQEAREELARRGQGARDELTRRGQEAGAELSRRLEALEGRLASIEELVRAGRGGARAQDSPERASPATSPTESKPEAEG